MAIRLRRVVGEDAQRTLVALCAARSVAKEGDIYLDDDAHNALSNKFARDYNEMFDLDLPGVYDDRALVEREESNNPARKVWDFMYGPDAPEVTPERITEAIEMLAKYEGWSSDELAQCLENVATEVKQG